MKDRAEPTMVTVALGAPGAGVGFALLFLLVPISWAGSFVAARYAVREVSTLGCMVVRFLLSGLLMLPLLAWFRGGRHPDWRDAGFRLHLAISVLVGGIGYHLLFFSAVTHSGPTQVAMLVALNPFLTALAEIVFWGRSRPRVFYLGLALAFAGAFWVNVGRSGGMNFSAFGRGEWLALGAAVAWSAYTIAARLTRKRDWDSLWLNAYSFLFTALLLLPFWPALRPGSPMVLPGVAALASLAYMAVFPTVIGYTLFYMGVQRRGPAWASAFIYLVPPFTAGFDFMFFDAGLTGAVIGGTCLVTAGLALGNGGISRAARGARAAGASCVEGREQEQEFL